MPGMGRPAMSEWEYRKIDLNQQQPGGDDLEVLNAAGAEGWELVGITSNHIAYLKREFLEVVPASTTHATPAAAPRRATASAEAEGPVTGHEVRVKYRDPVTKQTWSGCGPHGDLAQE